MVGPEPDYCAVARGYGVPQQLMLTGRRYTLEAGCRYVVGDARCAAFNGTDDLATGRVSQINSTHPCRRVGVTLSVWHT